MVWWTPIRLLVRILLERILCKVNIFYQGYFSLYFYQRHSVAKLSMPQLFFLNNLYFFFFFFFGLRNLLIFHIIRTFKLLINLYFMLSNYQKLQRGVFKKEKRKKSTKVKWVLTNSWKKSCFKEEGQKMQHTMIKIDCFSKLYQCFNFVKQP